MSRGFQFGGWFLFLVFLVATIYLATTRAPEVISISKTGDSPVASDPRLTLLLKLAQKEALLATAEELQSSCESGTDFAGATWSDPTDGDWATRGDMDEKSLTQALAVIEGKINDTMASLKACQEAGPPHGEDMAEEADEPGDAEAVASSEKKAEVDDKTGKESMERAAQAQMELLMDMVYGDFYQELGLTPEQRKLVNEALVANTNAYRKTTAAAMRSGTKTAREVRAERDGLRKTLHNDLSEFLKTEELAAFDQYELVADQILYERSVDGQLAMLAAGLSSENRQLTSQVMAEELVREFDLFDQTDEPYTLDNFNAAQARALTFTLERLTDSMPQEQYVLVDGFVNQALAVFGASASPR